MCVPLFFFFFCLNYFTVAVRCSAVQCSNIYAHVCKTINHSSNSGSRRVEKERAAVAITCYCLLHYVNTFRCASLVARRLSLVGDGMGAWKRVVVCVCLSSRRCPCVGENRTRRRRCRQQTNNRLNKIFNLSFYEPTTAWCKNNLGERDKLRFDHHLLLLLFL